MSSASLREVFSHPPYRDLGPDHGLRPLLPAGATASTWRDSLRPGIETAWKTLLGRPSYSENDYSPAPRLVREKEEDGFTAQLWLQNVGPHRVQRILILKPKDATPGTRLPCALVPFYDVERPAGYVVDAARGTALEPDPAITPERPLGLHLVRQGLLVACVEAFPFNLVPSPGAEAIAADAFAWWRAAAQKLADTQPGWTGLGCLVHDTRHALDLLLARPEADPSRVLMMGHSLGGKMSFFTGALDPRVTAVIASDFGLPWRSTNWNDPWYLGDRVPADDHGRALHELLALLAPRPFFLIAGDTDRRASWQYILATRPVYELLGSSPDGMPGAVDHASGHAPNLAALDVAYAWMREHFGLPHRPWRH